MKYIHHFENLKPDLYKEGDYVILDELVIKENGLHDIYENIGYIVNARGYNNMYNVDYLRTDFELENITQNFVYECEIIRKLSQEEVDDINAIIQSKKFNI